MTIEPLRMPDDHVDNHLGSVPDGHAGSDVLDEVEAFIGTFVAFPTVDARVATTCWIAHTHAVGAFESSPRLALLSPEPGSGKTRVLEVLELLTPNPMHVLSASAAAIFRTIEKGSPTLLFDEVDAIFGRRGNDDGNEDLRALLNAGHRGGATIPRCSGPTHEVRNFPVYAAAALAGLGDLPDTLMTRSVIVRMRRRAPGETVRPFRHRLASPEGYELRDRLGGWVTTVADRLRGAWPEMPDGVTDRAADCWEPLLAIAEAAGGDWPERARRACVELTKAGVSREASLGVRLLADLRLVFADEERMGTETILERLCAIDEAPWADLRGRPLDARGLARRLNNYEISSTQLKIEGHKVRGYRREDLWDAWRRYLPPEEAVPAVPPVPARSGGVPEVPDAGEVPVPLAEAVPEAPPLSSAVPQVPQVPDGQGGDGEGVLAVVLEAFPGSEVVSANDLRDLPLGEVGTCRHCWATTVRTDGEGTICEPCHEQRRAS